MRSAGAPQFKVDPYWPKPLPSNWILGQVAGIAVDKDDRIWIVHRPATLVDDEKGALANPPATKCCTPAPPVLQFDAQGNLLRSWGGKGAGFDWPESEHGIFVADDGNVWLAGNGAKDQQILQFTPEGKFLRQLGKPGNAGGSNSPGELGRPAHMVINSGELYVADGYATAASSCTTSPRSPTAATGARTASGRTTTSCPLTIRAWRWRARSATRCTACASRTRAWSMSATAPTTASRCSRRAASSSRSTASSRRRCRTARCGTWCCPRTAASATSSSPTARTTRSWWSTAARGETLSRFSRGGRMAGELKWVHNMAIDSRGNLYTAEVGTGRRAQKFLRVE